jgi:CO/xanthine dehydrogenase Mo-binding subunit
MSMLGLDENRVRVVTPDVGGGFGSKFIVYPEEVAVAAAAKLLGRPVRWIEDRREHVTSSIQERDQYWDLKVEFEPDGRLVAVRGTMICDAGAYTYQGINMPFNASTSGGRIVNPITAERQIHGGVVHGISNALFEWMAYDAEAQPLTVTFADYPLPTAADISKIDVQLVEYPSPKNPLGVKGLGESGPFLRPRPSFLAWKTHCASSTCVSHRPRFPRRRFLT